MNRTPVCCCVLLLLLGEVVVGACLMCSNLRGGLATVMCVCDCVRRRGSVWWIFVRSEGGFRVYGWCGWNVVDGPVVIVWRVGGGSEGEKWVKVEEEETASESRTCKGDALLARIR